MHSRSTPTVLSRAGATSGCQQTSTDSGGRLDVSPVVAAPRVDLLVDSAAALINWSTVQPAQPTTAATARHQVTNHTMPCRGRGCPAAAATQSVAAPIPNHETPTSLCPCRRQPGASLPRSRPPAQPVPPASDIHPRSAALMCPAAHRRERQRETNPLPAKWSKFPKRYKWRTLCPTAPRPISIFPAADIHVSSTAARTGHGRGRWGGRGSHLLCLFLQRLACTSLPIAPTATRQPLLSPQPPKKRELWRVRARGYSSYDS